MGFPYTLPAHPCCTPFPTPSSSHPDGSAFWAPLGPVSGHSLRRQPFPRSFALLLPLLLDVLSKSTGPLFPGGSWCVPGAQNPGHSASKLKTHSLNSRVRGGPNWTSKSFLLTRHRRGRQGTGTGAGGLLKRQEELWDGHNSTSKPTRGHLEHRAPCSCLGRTAREAGPGGGRRGRVRRGGRVHTVLQ